MSEHRNKRPSGQERPRSIDAREVLRTTKMRNTPRHLPMTRGECAGSARPCPYVSCRHHLYLDVTLAGGIKFNFGSKPWDDIGDTCVLDLAENGEMSEPEVGERMNMVRERVRQIAFAAYAKIQNDDTRLAG